MQKYQNAIQDVNGNAVAGATVAVYLYGTTTPATIYSDNGVTPIVGNSVTTSSVGEFFFYAANGRYSLTVTAVHFTSDAYNDITLFDPTDDGAAAINFLQAGTGAVVRTVQAKERDTVSVKDFGAVGDGVTDDTAAFSSFVQFLNSNGLPGYIPAGTYLISPINPAFSGEKAFSIQGAGPDSTVLKNKTPTNSFIYWTAANNFTLSDLTVDGDYSGTHVLASGATVAFVNSSHVTVRNVILRNIRRIGLLVFNDHQTTLANVYGDIVVDNVSVYGPTDYVFGTGPSAILLADVNDSSVRNCYIENIGLYGYELKNDSSRNSITNCVAVNAYYPIYFGGDGSHTELGYVKHSVVSDCIIKNGYESIVLGLASNNRINNVVIDNTTASSQYYMVDVRNGSNDNSISNITAIGRTTTALCTIRTSCNRNTIHFGTIFDGASTARGIDGIDATCGQNTVVFGTRDSTQAMYLPSSATYNNTIVDQKLNTSNLGISGSSLVKTRLGDIGSDAIFSTAKGFAYAGDFVDEYFVTAQNSQYKYIGSFSKTDIVTVRYRLTDGVKFETLYDAGAGTTSQFVLSSVGYYPSEDNVRGLGTNAARWKTTYSGNAQFSTAAIAGAASTVTLGATTATTVGAAGGASALPATPLGYLIAYVAGTQVKIPYYTA